MTETLISQPWSDRLHLDPGRLQLHAWRLSRFLGQASFPRETEEKIASPQASSTKSIYDGKWCIFCAWCGGWEADPFTACIPLITEFLIYLFQDKQLASGTVARYQAAIASAFKHTGLPDVGHDPTLSALLASSSRESSRRPRVFPQWDFSLVLMTLTRAPF